METSDESDSDNYIAKTTADDVSNSSYVCDICGLVYKRRKAFEIHIGMHDGYSPFVCHICQKQFTQNIGLRKHLMIHSGVPQYKVTTAFEKNKIYLFIVMCMNQVIPTFQCEFCDRSFIHEKTYKHHLTNHNGEKFVSCDVCQEGFNSSADLRRHKRVHTGEKPFSCDICGQYFTQNYNMLAHKRKIHENPDRKRRHNIRRQ